MEGRGNSGIGWTRRRQGKERRIVGMKAEVDRVDRRLLTSVGKEAMVSRRRLQRCHRKESNINHW